MENGLSVVRFIYMTYDKYNIKKENFDVIVNLIDNNVYATLLRAKEGFFVEHLSTTQRFIQQSNISTTERDNSPKKLMPNVFGSWGSNE